MIPPSDVLRQYKLIKSEIDRAISGTLNSGWFILGEKVKRFEEEFASFAGTT